MTGYKADNMLFWLFLKAEKFAEFVFNLLGFKE